MLVSHISDLHLGYSQFSLEEREEDVYQAFHEAIDVSIKEQVRLVILAGDLFHNPRPCGKAIITLGNMLKKLKEKQISAVFVLGEHDIAGFAMCHLFIFTATLGLQRSSGMTNLSKLKIVYCLEQIRSGPVASIH